MSNIYKVCSDDTFIMELEEEAGELFVHCKVLERSLSTIKKIKSSFQEMKRQLFVNGFDRLSCYIENTRFLKTIDDSFLPLTTVCHNGVTYEVVLWEL